jgi:hypothetical protein
MTIVGLGFVLPKRALRWGHRGLHLGRRRGPTLPFLISRCTSKRPLSSSVARCLATGRTDGLLSKIQMGPKRIDETVHHGPPA